MGTIIENLLGNISIAEFISLYIFAIIGMVLVLLIDSNGRDQSSVNTPVRFSWRFLLRDNYKRILLWVVVMYIMIRFGLVKMFVQSILGEGESASMEFSMVVVGASFDAVLFFIKNKFGFMKGNRKNNEAYEK